MPLSRPNSFERLLQLRLQNRAVDHITNASRTAFVVTNRPLLLDRSATSRACDSASYLVKAVTTMSGTFSKRAMR